MDCNSTVVVHIVHKGTGLAVQVHDDNKHLVLKPFENEESQHWLAQKTEWSTYVFTNRKNGKVLDCKKHAKVETVNNSVSQEWLCSNQGVFRNVKYDLVLSTKKKKGVLSPRKGSLNDKFCLHVCDSKASDSS